MMIDDCGDAHLYQVHSFKAYGCVAAGLMKIYVDTQPTEVSRALYEWDVKYRHDGRSDSQ